MSLLQKRSQILFVTFLILYLNTSLKKEVIILDKNLTIG
jgi:hypothetical protein